MVKIIEILIIVILPAFIGYHIGNERTPPPELIHETIYKYLPANDGYMKLNKYIKRHRETKNTTIFSKTRGIYIDVIGKNLHKRFTLANNEDQVSSFDVRYGK